MSEREIYEILRAKTCEQMEYSNKMQSELNVCVRVKNAYPPKLIATILKALRDSTSRE